LSVILKGTKSSWELEPLLSAGAKVKEAPTSVIRVQLGEAVICVWTTESAHSVYWSVLNLFRQNKSLKNQEVSGENTKA